MKNSHTYNKNDKYGGFNMIYIVLIVAVQILVSYSCIAAATTYDRSISDREQEAFLRLATSKPKKWGR